MPTFRQTDRMARWVTFTQTVEAATEEEAQDLFAGGDGTPVVTEIGDTLNLDVETYVEEVTPSVALDRNGPPVIMRAR